MSMVFPKLWSQNSAMLLQLTLSQINKYRHKINWKKEESIMEFGFADGKNSSLTLGSILPEDYKEFIATDISPEMVNYAKIHCDLPRSKILEMDIASTVPKEFLNRFDHVFGFMVIHRIKNPRQAFKNIYNMLKSKGTMFLTFFEKQPNDYMYYRLTQIPKWKKYRQEEMLSKHYFSQNPRLEYQIDLDAASFKEYIIEADKYSFSFPTEAEYNNLLISANSAIPFIPEEEREEYIKDYLVLDGNPIFSVSYKNGNKIITCHYTCLTAIATK